MSEEEYAEYKAKLDDLFKNFIQLIDEWTGNPEAISKARELQQALSAPQLDLEHITRLRYWFAGRPKPMSQWAADVIRADFVRDRLMSAINEYPPNL
jgi:hypothetical protein